jgi:hypothetical protein
MESIPATVMPRSCEPIAENPPTSTWLLSMRPVLAGGTAGGAADDPAEAPAGLKGVT